MTGLFGFRVQIANHYATPPNRTFVSDETFDSDGIFVSENDVAFSGIDSRHLLDMKYIGNVIYKLLLSLYDLCSYLKARSLFFS